MLHIVPVLQNTLRLELEQAFGVRQVQLLHLAGL